MKQKFFLLLCTIAYCLIGTLIIAQTPQKFSYQAIIRNPNGQPVTNAIIATRISILQDLGMMGMYPAYIETQTATTNASGLLSLQIGTGNVVNGIFSSIYWTYGTYFLKTEIDPLGGTNYTIVDSTQLLSVPYAMHAATSGDNYWASSGVGNIYYNNGGNVGIGISNPTNKLSVGGNANFTGNVSIGTTSPNNKLSVVGNQNITGNLGIGIITPSNKLSVVGNVDFSGNVGIGTTTPATKLAVIGKSYFSEAIGLSPNNFSPSFPIDIDYTGYTGVMFYIRNGTNGVGFYQNNGIVSLGSFGYQDFHLVSNSNTVMTLNPNGNIGIGTQIATAKLSVNGSANKPGGGSWTVYSDKRLKQNISPYYDGLKILSKITPIRFHYNEKSGCDTQQEYVGVIAQDLQQIAPYMVSTFQKDNTDYLSVDNSAMTYMLINAVKEQQTQIEALKQEIYLIRIQLTEQQQKKNSWLILNQ